MKNFTFSSARFETTAVSEEGYPDLKDESGNVMPEIAVVGRSNVGKSSLMNFLFQKKGLVKTSARPGKTQTLNFFVVDESLCIVDLPGYGFAKVPAHMRKKWGLSIQEYLEKRSELELILFLLDMRRTPNEDDMQFLEWAAYHGKRVVIALTKVDKLKLNERKKQKQKIKEKLEGYNCIYVQTSVPKRVGRKELINLLNAALRGEVPHLQEEQLEEGEEENGTD